MARTYEAPHEVRDEALLESMIQTLRNGGELPAIVVTGDTALTGSHRIAAWAECDIDAVAVECPDELYVAALESLGLDIYDSVNDYNEFCAALYDVAGDYPGLQDALEDQRS